MSVLAKFCDWLEQTPLSQTLQIHEWIVPAVQTVHILAIALVMSAVMMLGLRLLNIVARDQSTVEVADRFLPVLWWALPVLLLSGLALIIAEPGRSLQNPVFVAKMSLLAIGIMLTAIFQRGVHRDASFWEVSSTRRLAAKSGAALGLAVWVAIVFAGRWIAYVQSS